jgi:hypothetical protein
MRPEDFKLNNYIVEDNKLVGCMRKRIKTIEELNSLEVDPSLNTKPLACSDPITGIKKYHFGREIIGETPYAWYGHTYSPQPARHYARLYGTFLTMTKEVIVELGLKLGAYILLGSSKWTRNCITSILMGHRKAQTKTNSYEVKYIEQDCQSIPHVQNYKFHVFDELDLLTLAIENGLLPKDFIETRYDLKKMLLEL